MKKSLTVFALCFFAVFAVAAGQAMAVDVYAEGAYTDSDLVVYIYADVDAIDELRSAGVKLSYDTGQLDAGAVDIVRGGEWVLESDAGVHPYADPLSLSGPGEVVLICGKLDGTDPDPNPGVGTEEIGVMGDRKLIGEVTFSRLNQTDPGVDPEAFFGLSLGLGQENPTPGEVFDNFVSVDGQPLDGSLLWAHPDPFFGGAPIVVRRRGDANGDGAVNVNDMRTLRRVLGDSDLPCYVDCNGDGAVNVNDMRCLRRSI